MINKVTLIGNLGADPEVKTLENGAKVARFSLATNESYQDKMGEWQKKTEWHNVVVWRTLADRVERDYKKGMMVYVEGKISYRKWQDQEGKDKYTTDIVPYTLRMLERREGGVAFNKFPSAEDEVLRSPKKLADPIQSSPQAAQPRQTESPQAKMTETEDDLPF